jgi:hypothetical protein
LAIVTLHLINSHLVFIKKKLSADTRRLRSLDMRTPADENIQCNDQTTAKKKVVDQMHGPTLYFKEGKL